MATSRLEKIGTIYTRIQGLLRAGALKFEDRPIWYEVYEAFPPKNLPVEVKNTPLPQILYPEDEIRARFQKENSENMNLFDKTTASKCQAFISKFEEIHSLNPDKSTEEIYSEAIKVVKASYVNESAEEYVIKSNDSYSVANAFKTAQRNQEIKLTKKIDISDVMKED